jgi:endonuclease III
MPSADRRRPAIYSRDLGLDLAPGRERELFRWLLACLLFGKPIQQAVARRAWGELLAARLDTPAAILDAGWDRLVEVLDRGHYVRFDFSTASKLLEVSRALIEQYGTLSNLLRRSTSRADLGRRLQRFKGVGPTTARIFLRDVARAWRPRAAAGSRAARRGRGSARGPAPDSRPTVGG